MKNTFLFFVIAFILFSCKEKSDPVGNSNTMPVENINYSNPKIGQIDKYLRFFGSNNIAYTKDTLLLEVISQNAGWFVLKEGLTPGSELLKNEPNGYGKSRTYKVRLIDDSLEFQPVTDEDFSSFLLGRSIYLGKSGKGFKLQTKDYQDNLVSVNGFSVNIWPNHTGYILNLDLLGLHYDRLNVLFDDYYDAVDAGTTLIVYSLKNGIVRTSFGGGDSPNTHGWNRMKNL